MTPTPTARTIFRPEAVRRYSQGVEQAILPSFVSPRAVVWLWALFGLLVAALTVSWAARIPVYASGVATVVRWRDPARRSGSPVLVVFLPPSALPRLRSGQTVILAGDGVGENARVQIGSVERGVVGPVDAQREFGLSAGAARALTSPSAVALAPWKAPPTGAPSAAYVGSVYRANVAQGARRALSFVPIVGRWGEG